MLRRLLTGIAAGGLLLGCAAVPQQAPTTAKVVEQHKAPRVTTIALHLSMVKGGKPVNRSRATLSVNNFMDNCGTIPAGHHELRAGDNEITLPIGQPVLMIVELQLGENGVEGRNLRGAVLQPRAGAHYQFHITAVEGRFNYQLLEITREGKQELELVTTYSGCRSSRAAANRAG